MGIWHSFLNLKDTRVLGRHDGVLQRRLRTCKDLGVSKNSVRSWSERSVWWQQPLRPWVRMKWLKKRSQTVLTNAVSVFRELGSHWRTSSSLNCRKMFQQSLQQEFWLNKGQLHTTTPFSGRDKHVVRGNGCQKKQRTLGLVSVCHL